VNNKIRDFICSLAMIGNYDFGGYCCYDSKVNDCLMDMYLYMMYPNGNKKEEFFHEFEKKYNDLNDEQKEIVKKDYIEIIEAQDRNIEKEKVKKKGMNNYE